MPIPVPYTPKGEDMNAIIAIRNAANAVTELAGTAPNAKTTREALESLATEVRACTDASPEVPKAAAKIDEAREGMHGLVWNAKGGIAEDLLALGLALYDAADALDAKPTTNRLAEIAEEVKAAQQTAAEAAIQIGGLLTEARGEFEKQAEFLAWAKAELGYGKTFAYRLMKIHAEFKDADDLHGMSLRALHALTGISEEGKAAVLSLASSNKASGKPAPTEAEVKGHDTTPEAPAAPAQATQGEEGGEDTGEQLQADDAAPWATGAKDLDTPAAPAAPAAPSQSEEVQRLYDIIEGLREDLAKAREASDTGRKAKASAPMLPQFRNDCYAARLGLSEAQAADPAKVKRALRDLVRLGYNSKHEAYPLLAEAADSLQDTAKAA